MQESAELRQMMHELYAAMAKGETDWVADVLSSDEATVAIGSDPAEYREGGATVREKWIAQLQAGRGMTAGMTFRVRPGRGVPSVP